VRQGTKDTAENFLELRYGEVRRIPIPRTWVNKGIIRARAYRDPGPVDDLPSYPAALQTTGGVYPASYSPRLHPAIGLVWSG
jgi:hypothetical protein